MITLEQFAKAVPCTILKASTWHPAITRAMLKWGITTDVRAAGFIAQMSYESGGFSRFEENLNYSAQGLANTWPSRYAVVPSANPKVPNQLAWSLNRNPVKIANYTYANRMGNGSVDSGDGWLYRGRGPKQITGHDNYAACGGALGLDLLMHPELLLDVETGAQSAGWYWATHHCNELIDSGDFKGTTIAINGGLLGEGTLTDTIETDRIDLWCNCKAVLGVA
jgi:putative chitinase